MSRERPRAPRAAALLCALALASATACEVSFPHAARPTASLRLKGVPPTPPDAVVTIDEERVGPIAVVAVRGVALREGTHQVTVESPGFFPWDRLVEAKPTVEKRIELAVELRRVPE